MQTVLLDPDICTLLLRYRQWNDGVCRLDILFPDSSQPIVEALGLDAAFHGQSHQGDSQEKVFLDFNKIPS